MLSGKIIRKSITSIKTALILVVALNSTDVFATKEMKTNLGSDGRFAISVNGDFNLDVDGATGALSTSIPIEVPTGRGGVTPEISLVYNSYRKIGLAGMGWDLEIGHVERSTLFGVPSYNNSEDTFFLVMGNKRAELVNVTGSNEYREKIEGDFKKIEFINQEYWLVIDKNGRKHIFGQSALGETRVVDQNNSQKVYKYLLERVEDTHGNYMDVTYTTEYGSTEHLYPREIGFTGSTTHSPFAKILIEYETLPYTRFSYISGFRIDYSKRIDSIDVKLLPDTLIRRYDLTYTDEPKANHSLLTQIDRVGTNQSALPPITMQYSQPEIQFEANSSVTNHPPVPLSSHRVRMMDMNADGAVDIVYSPEPAGTPWQIYFADGAGDFFPAQDAVGSPPLLLVSWMGFGQDIQLHDFNGDALIDVLYGDENNQYIQLNNGENGFFPPYPMSQAHNMAAALHALSRFIDMDGDGSVDTVFGGSSWLVAYNDGAGKFDEGYTATLTGAPSRYINDGSYRHHDFNGDGLIDIVVSISNTYMNNGDDGYDVANNSHPSFWPYESNNYSDLNGDGLTDFYKTVWPMHFHYNNGYGKFLPGIDLSEADSSEIQGGFIWVDINNDNYADMLNIDYCPGSYENYRATFNNNGVGFVEDVTLLNVPSHETFNTVCTQDPDKVDLVVADIDGDGRVDLLYGGDREGQGAVEYEVLLGVTDPSAAKSGLLTKIDYSNGYVNEFTYVAEPIEGLMGPQYGYAFRSMKFFPVATKKTTVTATNQQYFYAYEYSGGLWDRAHREFRGFSEVKSTLPDLSYRIETFHQTEFLQGRPISVEIFDQNDSLFERTLYQWQLESVVSGSEFVYLSQVDRYTFDGDSFGRRTQEKFIYGESPQLGNLTEHIELGEVDLATGADIGDDKRTKITTFVNNTAGSNYLIGYPSTIEVQNQPGTRKQLTLFYYDQASSPTTAPTKGRLTKRRYWLDHVPSSEWPEEVFEYDVYGNIEQIVDPEQNETLITYDQAWSVFPVTITDALGKQEHFEYYGVDGVPLVSGDGYQGLFGQIKSQENVNGQITRFVYDEWGRLTDTVSPLDSIGSPTVEYEYLYEPAGDPTHKRVIKRHRIESGNSETIETHEFYDGLDRLIQRKVPLETAGEFSVRDQVKYDYRGLKSEIYIPYVSTNPVQNLEPIVAGRTHAKITHDVMGRVVEETVPDSDFYGTSFEVITLVDYDDWTITTTDAKGYETEHWYDAFGRLIRTIEDNDVVLDTEKPITDYYYDALDNLVRIEADVNGLNQTGSMVVTEIDYDGLNRKTSLVDPDIGTWNYEYFKNGNLKKVTDARGIETQYSYTALNQIKTKSYFDPSGTSQVPLPSTVTYTYGDDDGAFNVNKLISLQDQSGIHNWFYDELGRAWKETKSIATGTHQDVYSIEREYDLLDRLSKVKYPDQDYVDYVYNSQGEIESVTLNGTQPIVSETTYNEHGRKTQMLLGNGVTSNFEYYPETQRIKEIQTFVNYEEPLLNPRYRYDEVGNISYIHYWGRADHYRYTYDNLHRLIELQNDSYQPIRQYEYDAIGNLTSKDGVSFQYGQNGAPPHAVSFSGEGILFQYDQNGSMVSKQPSFGVGVQAQDFVYDAENRLVEVNTEIPEYIDITFEPGWNFFSLPGVPADSAVEAVFPNFGTDFSQVSRYDVETDTWSIYAKKDGDVVAQFTDIEYGVGYEVWCTSASPVTLSFATTQPTEPVSLELLGGVEGGGWHLLPSIVLSPAVPKDVYADLAAEDYQELESSGYHVQGADLVEPGKAYWVLVIETTNWIPALQGDRTTQFIYDGEGNRVKEIFAPGKERFVFGNLFEVREDSKRINYIYMGNELVASYTPDDPSDPESPDDDPDLKWHHAEHLGSIGAVSQETGDRIDLFEYWPYGQTKSSQGPDVGKKISHGFTSQRRDHSSGYYFYGSRYYDPDIGRFIQADSIVPDPFDPQMLNRYSYVRNNPLRFSDPTGHSPDDDDREIEFESNNSNSSASQGGGSGGATSLGAHVIVGMPRLQANMNEGAFNSDSEGDSDLIAFDYGFKNDGVQFTDEPWGTLGAGFSLTGAGAYGVEYGAPALRGGETSRVGALLMANKGAILMGARWLGRGATLGGMYADYQLNALDKNSMSDARLAVSLTSGLMSFAPNGYISGVGIAINLTNTFAGKQIEASWIRGGDYIEQRAYDVQYYNRNPRALILDLNRITQN